jgi:hemoglobin
MRHAPFHIATKERDEWLNCMRQAVDGLEINTELKTELWNFLEMAANSMVNQPD